MSHDECGKVVYRPYRNSIEFSLSTQTWSVVKSSQAKSLHYTICPHLIFRCLLVTSFIPVYVVSWLWSRQLIILLYG